jgi:general secretion pathway protein A
MLNGLHRLLIEGYRQNHNFVVFIDEAQNIPLETLENLRMLSNLETPKDKLIEIVLVGQPELLRLLNLRELRQVKQRIAIHSDIPPLSPSESLEYIRYRLKKAGGDIDRIFTKWAINRIIEESRGIPRLMNIICDNALITGFGYQKKLVGRKIVKEVIADLMVRQKPSCPLRWGVTLPLLVLIIPFYYFGLPYVKTLIGKNMVEVAPQTATSSVVNGTSVNASLPRDNPGNETTSSQLTSVATSSSLSPNGPDPVSLSTESRRKEKAGLETSVGPKPLPVASMKGGPSPAVAPPESSSPDVLTTQSPIPSESPTLAGEPVKVATHPRKSSIRRTIKKGDTLSHLAMEVYGYYGPEIITILRQHNPSIKNPDKIMVGDEVLFPVVDGTKHAQ